jgi:zinc and cadmium transporter
MAQTWFYTILSVLVISLVSLIGIFTLSVNIEKLKKILLFLVSFAAGALLGDAFIHLLPESFKETSSFLRTSWFILLGIVFFFILEKILFWRHCHIPTSEEHPHPVGIINLVSDGFHNLIDGVIIAGSFLLSPPVGLATALAVLLHEIPQEIGDFGILLHAGYTRRKALLFNFISALVAVLGAVLTLAIGAKIEGIAQFIIPLTIGGFIYIAAADLIPTIHREEHTGHSLLQLLFFLMGVGVMALLLFLG